MSVKVERSKFDLYWDTAIGLKTITWFNAQAYKDCSIEDMRANCRTSNADILVGIF